MTSASALASATDLESQRESQEGHSVAQSNDAEEAKTAVCNEPRVAYKLNKKFMMTPCNHSYHAMCLKKWMEIREECPTCRQAIPTIDDDR